MTDTRLSEAFAHLGLRPSGAWNGLVTDHRYYATDGVTMLRLSQVDHEKLEAQGIMTRYHRRHPGRGGVGKAFSAVSKLWNDYVERATEPLEGPTEWGRSLDGIRVAVFEGEDLCVHLDPHRVRLLTYLTSPDDVRGYKPEKPAVFYRGSEPVALLASLRQYGYVRDFDAEENAA